MKRFLSPLLGAALAVTAAYAQESEPSAFHGRIDTSRVINYLEEYQKSLRSPKYRQSLSLQSSTDVITRGADWLLTQQFSSGGFPWTVGDSTTEEDTQGGTARGMLASYDATSNSAYFNSAVRTGDFLVPVYTQTFPDGDPNFAAEDPLFLEELSIVSGDAKYADFVQTHFWDKLRTGTYGANNDLDAAEFADTIIGFDEYQPWIALRTWFVSRLAIAAQLAGEWQARDAFMADVLQKLEATTSTEKDGDLNGLAGAVSASAYTGINLDPLAGRWSACNSTADLADTLKSFQRAGGDWPYDTGTRAASHVGDVSATTWAVLALKAWNSTYFSANISNGLSFIQAQQQPNGQILTNPGYSPTTETGVQIHGHALLAFATDGGTLPVDEVSVAAKVFLEGPYAAVTNEMSVLGNAIPKTSPYSEDPRSVTTVPAQVADWVLVELRSTPAGTTVASRSAFLHKDGRIVDSDGASNEIAMAAPRGDYYVVVRHRNHLAVMSAGLVSLARGSSVLYDFTTGADKFYGSAGAKELEPGVWGLWSGDVNQDRAITGSDYDGWFDSARSASSGYQSADFNFDGQVTTSDYTIWHNNARQGAVSSLP